MSDLLSPQMNLSLMQAAQGETRQGAQAVKNLKHEREIARAQETAQDFEAMFVAEMLKPMFEGISTEAPFGGCKGEEIFRGMLLQEYGKVLAHSGSIGLTDQIKQQIIALQEQADQQPKQEGEAL